MPQILGFSERTKAAVQGWLKDHPVYSVRAIGEVNMESALVRVTAVRCVKCHQSLPPPQDIFPSGALAAMEFTHDWSLNRAYQCGGRVRIETAPVLGLVPVDAIAGR